MNGPALAGAADGIQRMRDSVRGWARQHAVAEGVQLMLAAGNARSKTLRNEIASALKEIDAGGRR